MILFLQSDDLIHAGKRENKMNNNNLIATLTATMYSNNLIATLTASMNNNNLKAILTVTMNNNNLIATYSQTLKLISVQFRKTQILPKEWKQS